MILLIVRKVDDVVTIARVGIVEVSRSKADAVAVAVVLVVCILN